MSRAFRSDSGRLVTIQQDDGNYVMYPLRPDGAPDFAHPIADEWSWAEHGTTPEPPGQPIVPSTGGAGGFVEHSTSTAVRPRLTDLSFIPERGPFRFPAPYNTRGFRITNPSDGHVRPNGMAYWPILNAHAGQSVFRVIVSIDDVLTLFLVDKASWTVTKIGPLPFHTTGEGCYWSLRDPNLLYVPSGQSLFAYNVVSFNGGDAFHARPGTEVHQVHSSADGQVHSMTRNGDPAVARDGKITAFPSPSGKKFDECQIAKSGRWLFIRETDPDTDQLWNRVIQLSTSKAWEWKAGAVGHCDTGWDYVVGEDANADQPGVFRLWHFTADGPMDGGIVYHMIGWDSMTRYVSHCNAVEGHPDAQHILISSSHDGDLSRANELVSVRLDGSLLGRVLCPNLADLSGLSGDELYWAKTRAALCPTGQYAAFSSTLGLFVVELS